MNIVSNKQFNTQHNIPSIYDLIIIGAGPAGLTASIYASRYRIKHLVIGKELGGAMALAWVVENYPGFKRISGMELTKKMVEQAKELGGEIVNDEVVEIKNLKLKIKNDNVKFKIITASGREYKSRAVILATGTRRRELGVPGEKRYLGRGVSYCATCDAPFFRNKTVAVIGGANAAVMSASHLAEFAKKVYIIYRGKPLRAEPIWRERVEKNPKIEIIYETNVTEILGDGKTQMANVKSKSQISKLEVVGGIKLDKQYRGREYLPVDGVFIEIGGVPGAELVKPLGVEVDEKGFVKVGPDMATNVPGIFAAGDIANAAGKLQQIVTACSEGAIAATSVYKFLNVPEV
ncbi:MAG: NAD(P)/FAD-dependent oxidoreductase [Microgenomates group bacterium]